MILLSKGVMFVVDNYDKLIKFEMPNGKNIDILDNVGEILKKNIQHLGLSEAGGVLIGYTHKSLGSVVIEEATEPQIEDSRSILGFFRKSNHHLKTVKVAKRRNSGYMGNWHTHPCDYPEPSFTDISSWKESLDKESSSCDYLFFIIIGLKGYRIWVGNTLTKNIIEIFQTKR